MVEKKLIDELHSDVYSSLLPAYECDLRGIFTAVNQKALDLFQYSKDDFLVSNFSLLDIVGDEWRDYAFGQLKKIITGETTHGGEYQVKRKDGSTFYASVYSNPIYQEAKIIGFRGILIDITEKHIAQENLAKEQKNLYAMFKSNPSIQSISEPSSRKILEINDKFTELLGYSRDEIVGYDPMELGIVDYISEKDLDQHRDEAGNIRNFEVIMKAKNGTTIYGLLSSEVIEYANLNCILVSITDITELYEKEKKLRESELLLRENQEKYNAITEKSIIAIAIVQNEEIFFMNERMQGILGYKGQDLLGRPISFFLRHIHPDYLGSAETALKMIQDEAVNFTQERFCMVSRTGKETWLLSSIKPTQLPSGIAYMFVGVDITEQVIAEEQRDKEFLRTQKLESLGLLAGGIAHDFNNILMGLLGNIQIMAFSPNIDQELEQSLKDMENAVLSASQLTRQLLTFSKGGTPIKTVENIEDVLSNNVRLAMRGSRSEYRVSITPDLPYCEIDKGQIGQVIQNLIINANQALPEGGLIKINVRMVDQSHLKPEFRPADYICIDIEDNGTGIPKHLQNKIFNPYFTTKPGGHGLGLATSYSIIQKHQGYLYFNSQSGVGTTFTILLPITTKKPRINSRRSSKFQKYSGRVLILDDNEEILKTSKQLLENIGFSITTSTGGQDAIQKYTEALNDLPFRFCILDLVIPNDLGGLAVLQKLLKIDPQIKAIASSGYSNDEVLSNYEEYGFSAVLPKPYTFHALQKVVHTLLA